ncbi:hypothetical protein RND71_009166 [Anisodus tanguticus]|uniref:F-box associated beta-propeller type 1 domain-containing protein n=1 Tax=Anisodus tanguticus TaxID=243964 RepID=A0AAE1SHB0_9SOLA|nr:hypothetical protein RND71_009166 [Anisodus tanguticus]
MALRMCCCDGLVVVHGIDDTNDKRSIIMLWNPSTRESIVLPNPEIPPRGYHRMGLGYDSTSGDCKILKIRTDKDGSKVPDEILTLKSDPWRNIDKHPRGICSQVSGMDSALTFVNDEFHWIGMFGNHVEVSRTYFVVSFNISNEVYREILLPEQILRLKGNNIIGVSELD